MALGPCLFSEKYPAYDRFHGNGPYGEIPTKKEPIRTLGFAFPYNNFSYFPHLHEIERCHCIFSLSTFLEPLAYRTDLGKFCNTDR